VAAFLKALTREDVAPVTVRGYRSDLGLFAAWYDGHPHEKLTASDLAHFRQYLSRERSILELPFQAERGSERLLAAIELARELNREHARNLPPDACLLLPAVFWLLRASGNRRSQCMK
jgi:hypothetical protein